MNALDIVIIIIFAACIIRGVYQGLLRGISSLVAIIAGLLLAKRYYLSASPLLLKLDIPNAYGITGYILIFLFFYIIIRVIFLLLHRLFQASGLSPLDRLLGGSLGIIKAMLYVLILVSLILAVLPKDSAITNNSKSLPYFKKAIVIAGTLAPQGLQSRFKKIK